MTRIERSIEVIVTKYLGPTNYRGSRISVTHGDRRRYIAYDHAAHNAHDSAVEEFLSEEEPCRREGRWVGGVICGKGGYAYVWVPEGGAA